MSYCVSLVREFVRLIAQVCACYCVSLCMLLHEFVHVFARVWCMSLVCAIVSLGILCSKETYNLCTGLFLGQKRDII